MSSMTKFLRVTCLKDWQSQTPSSVTWSAKMTAYVYPWIISLCPKKTIVSSTTLTKTWSQRRWNGGKGEIIMIWWEATRWRWDKIIYLIPYSFIYQFRKQSKYPKMFKFVNKISISTRLSFAVLLKKQVCYMSVRAKDNFVHAVLSAIWLV